MKNNYAKLSIIGSLLLTPLTFGLTYAVSTYLKSGNPDKVDITVGLAYLRPILITTLVTLLVTGVFSIVTFIMSARHKEDRDLTRFAAVMLVTSLLLFFVNAGLQSKNASIIEDAFTAKIESCK